MGFFVSYPRTYTKTLDLYSNPTRIEKYKQDIHKKGGFEIGACKGLKIAWVYLCIAFWFEFLRVALERVIKGKGWVGW